MIAAWSYFSATWNLNIGMMSYVFAKKKTLTIEIVRVGNKKPGGDLLSHTLVCSTIGDEGLDF